MSESVVYFVQQSTDGPIKIGVTADICHRMSQLQTGSSTTLSLLATTPGDVETERQLHHRFTEHRLHGEWFAPAEPVLALVRSLQPVWRRTRRARAAEGTERVYAGACLRAALERQGVSRSEFAAIAGLDEKHVRQMISGDKPIPVHLVLCMPPALRADFLRGISDGVPVVAPFGSNDAIAHVMTKGTGGT